MTVFRKSKAHRYFPVHSTKMETVETSLHTFYTKLADHQDTTNVAFDEFVDLGKIIPKVISLLLENMAAIRPFMQLAQGLNTKKNYGIAPTIRGQSTASVYTGPLQSFLVFGASRLFGTQGGRDVIKRLMFFPPTSGSDSFTQGNAHLLLWWDTLNSCGEFVQPFEAYPNVVLDLSKPIACSILMCTQPELSQPQTIKHVFEFTGVRYSFFDLNTEYVQTSKYPKVGTYITVPVANELAKAILSQKAAFFRQKFMKAIHDLIFDNRIWQMAFLCSATGRQKTIEQYIGHIRSFSTYTGMPLAKIFDNMRDECFSDSLLQKFFLKRLSRVNIDTVIQGIHAFNWFYRRFHPGSKRFHEKVVDIILKLRKRLKNEKHGSDSLEWDKMKLLLAQIKQFDWGKFSAVDIYNLAVISLWGALRISESVALSRLTAVLLTKQDLLRVTVWDGKSATGDKLQWKYLSNFPDHPEFCPHKAFETIGKVQHYDSLITDANNKPITTTKLSTLFKKFISSLQGKDILPKGGKFTWHLFRVSYMNIAFHQFGIPLHYCAANACHQALTSSKGYVGRQAEKRRKLAAKTFAVKASENMKPKNDPALAAFFNILDTSESV